MVPESDTATKFLARHTSLCPTYLWAVDMVFWSPVPRIIRNPRQNFSNLSHLICFECNVTMLSNIRIILAYASFDTHSGSSHAFMLLCVCVCFRARRLYLSYTSGTYSSVLLPLGTMQMKSYLRMAILLAESLAQDRWWAHRVPTSSQCQQEKLMRNFTRKKQKIRITGKRGSLEIQNCPNMVPVATSYWCSGSKPLKGLVTTLFA